MDDAVVLAGALAESGVQTIEVCASGEGWKSFSARVTDLPGLITAQAQDGTELRWPGGGARVELGKLRWWGAAGAAAQTLPPSPA